MKVVIQRVSQASVTIEGRLKSSINSGLLVLVGIIDDDSQDDVEWLTNKIVNLRIFNDEAGVMNNSLMDIKGQCLLISQFTLHAKTKKGNRPSYIDAAKPDIAIPLYENFVKSLQKALNGKVETGEFGADMKVSLINDGPVTIVIDSKNRV